MWIKICGTTTLEDAKMAFDCGADALGFIFAPSPRRVSVEAARLIGIELPPPVERYGVFVDPSLAEATEAVESCGLTGVQLHLSPRHREQQPKFSLLLHEYFLRRGQKLRIIHAIRWTGESSGRGFRGILKNRGAGSEIDPATDLLLVDRSHGTGTSFDWRAAREDFLDASRQVRTVVAGGLSATNVAEAISILHPWGVDVVSGVEVAPGRKDRGRLERFIRNARLAAAEAGEEQHSLLTEKS